MIGCRWRCSGTVSMTLVLLLWVGLIWVLILTVLQP